MYVQRFAQPLTHSLNRLRVGMCAYFIAHTFALCNCAGKQKQMRNEIHDRI